MARPGRRSVMKVPLFGTRIGLPDRGSMAWYAGLGAMTALEVIEWPIAIVVAASHALATHARQPAAREVGERTDAAG